MGNGGCGCNVTNSNLVSEQVLSRKSNRKKLLNLDLTIIDLKLCEQYEIGPYITRAYATKLSSGFTNKSLIILNSYISLLNYPKKLRKVKEIETIIDYEILTSQNNLLKIYDKIFETTDDKLKETLNFCWNNTLRLLIFVIILIIENKHDNRNPKITNEYVTSNSEKLILKDNKNNIQEDKKEETLLNMINKDVPRTLSEKISSCEILSYNLRDILLTVSMQDNTLGYVQGMNFITAFILILTGNQKNLALDLFKSILNMHSDLFNMNFKETLTDNFALLFKYIQKIKEILKIENIKLYNKIDMLLLDDFLWISQWIQTLFTYKFNFIITVKMWDIIIAYGIDVIIILIPIILEFFDKKLKIVKNVEEFLSVLDDFYKLQGLDFSQFLLFIFKMLKNKKYRKYLNLKKF